jgi:hypothetical protein
VTYGRIRLGKVKRATLKKELSTLLGFSLGARSKVTSFRPESCRHCPRAPSARRTRSAGAGAPRT